MTPIAQDDSWAKRQQEDTPVQDETPHTPSAQVTYPVLDDDNYMETTPSPKASPAFRRIRKGLKPSVSMSTIPEEDSQQSNSVAHQVFLEENASATVQASEANATEDIPSALVEEERREEEREATPPATDQVILEENAIVSDPPVVDQMEVENTEAATNNATEANDPVMAEDNVEPEANVNVEATVMPVITDGAVPPPRPHTMELAFDHNDHLVIVC